VTHDEAVDLISSGRLAISTEPATWADLGCGDGTFTLALASLLPAGSTIHAVDQDAATLRGLPDEFHGSRIVHHHADFTQQPWPFSDLDGILMANSLHYVRHQSAFIRKCASQFRAHHQFLIVEYDLRRGNPWVPYPIEQKAARELFRDLGYTALSLLGTRPSRYQRGSLYSLLATTGPVALAK
jgi:ubiquinone/menaquinone biosynthesis C-methylase UbiE